MKKALLLEEERDFGKKINATFDFIKQEHTTIFGYFIYLVLPLAILSGVFAGLYTSNISELFQNTRSIDNISRFFSFNYFLLFVVSISTYSMLITSTLCFMKLYKESSSTIGYSEVFEEVKKYFFNNTLLIFVVGILSTLGTIFCVLPGIFLFVSFSFASIFLVLEDNTIGGAINNTFALIKDHWWETFGLILILYLIYGVISGLFGLPNLILTKLMFTSLEVNKSLFIALSILSNVGSMIALVIVIIGIAFQYFNLKEIKNNTSLINDIDNIGTTKNL